MKRDARVRAPKPPNHRFTRGYSSAVIKSSIGQLIGNASILVRLWNHHAASGLKMKRPDAIGLLGMAERACLPERSLTVGHRPTGILQPVLAVVLVISVFKVWGRHLNRVHRVAQVLPQMRRSEDRLKIAQQIINLNHRLKLVEPRGVEPLTS
jgi:hypothetical protein